MRALLRDRYGTPDVLTLGVVADPTPGDSEILVRTKAASIAKGDWEILTGNPSWVRLAGFGIMRPKHAILGYNFSGIVEAVGQNVTRFHVGDAVFGDTLNSGLGAFAEKICIR